MVARGNLRLKALSAKLQAQADVTSNAIQVMNGTARSAWMRQRKSALRSAAHGTALPASAQEHKAVRQSLQTQCGTRFQASLRLTTAQAGRLQRQQPTTIPRAQTNAATNALQAISGARTNALQLQPG